jgi:hypothetical protein
MENKGCVSQGTLNERKGRRHLLLPVLALLFQPVPPVLLWGLATAAYAEPRRLPEPWERPLSLVVLGFSAGVSLLLGGVGAYRLLRRARPRVAVLLILLCCLPALFAGAVYLHGLLVFLAWV